MDEQIIERADISDNKYMTEKVNKKMLRVGLDMRDEYENAKMSRIRAYLEGKLDYKPMLDRIR